MGDAGAYSKSCRFHARAPSLIRAVREQRVGQLRRVRLPNRWRNEQHAQNSLSLTRPPQARINLPGGLPFCPAPLAIRAEREALP